MNSSLPAPRYPYGRTQRYHLQHVHLFAQDIEQTIDFYTRWFDAEVAWDGGYGGARNVFLKIGIGALHLYDQAPRELRRNAVHHLGMQVVGLLMVSAMMIVPIAAAQQVTRSFVSTLVVGMLIGLSAAIVGLIASFYADVPPGPTIVLLALATFAVLAVVGVEVRRRVAAR